MGENSIPGFYAVGIITLLQGLPVYALITIPYKLKYTSFKLDIGVGVFSILLILGLNSFLYLIKENNLKVMRSVEALDKKKLVFVRSCAVIYICIAITLVISLLMI